MSAKNENICPACGSRDKTNMYMYGSPIRKCSRCGKEYLNSKFREVAIDGFDPKTESPSSSIKAILGLTLLSAFCGAYAYKRGSIKMSIMFVVCVIAVVFYIVMLFRYLLGFEKRLNERELKKSEERLRDKNYVEKLQQYGYKIPNKYLYDNF